MVDRAEKVKQAESSLVERMFEVLSSVRVVKSFAREAARDRAFHCRRRRDHARAAAPDLAGVALRHRSQRHHAGRHRAHPHGGRHARARWQPHRGQPAGGAGVPRRRLHPAVVDRPHRRRRCSRRWPAPGASARSSRITPETDDPAAGLDAVGGRRRAALR